MEHLPLVMNPGQTTRAKASTLKVIAALLITAGLIYLTRQWNHLPMMLPLMLIIACPFIRFFVSRKDRRLAPPSP